MTQYSKLINITLPFSVGDKMFGIEFVPNMEISKLVDYCVLAEENGFGAVWITDHYNNRNVYATLAMVASRTSRIKLGPGVTNPYHIHPALTASAIATINEISEGRAMLGIGAGDKTTLEKLGIQWTRPLTYMRETVEVIKQLLEGKSVNYDGKVVKIQGARLDFKAGEIPVYIGAQGAKMLELAGELGNGVLVNASHPRDFDFAVKQVKKGMEKTGKTEFDVVAYTCMSVDNDSQKARNSARIVVAFIVAGSPDIIFERHGIPLEDVSKVREALNNAFTKGDWAGVGKAVTDDMLESFSIAGSPSEVIEKVIELRKIGVTQIVAGSPIGPSKKDSIRLIGSEIIPQLTNP